MVPKRRSQRLASRSRGPQQPVLTAQIPTPVQGERSVPDLSTVPLSTSMNHSTSNHRMKRKRLPSPKGASANSSSDPTTSAARKMSLVEPLQVEPLHVDMTKMIGGGRARSASKMTLDSNIYGPAAAGGMSQKPATPYLELKRGQLLGSSKYVIHSQNGKGMYSSVAIASRVLDGKMVAIKAIRKSERMMQIGSKEAELLQRLKRSPEEKRRYLVEYLETFQHCDHLCLVFEPMRMNMRQLLFQKGRHVGIELHDVQLYSKQILLALKTLRAYGIVHADIKPDNILVSNDLKVAKLCDFGCAYYVQDTSMKHTSYMVSRFYRAPEVILGLPQEYVSTQIDMWALAACVFELFAGKILFPGKNNNEMLRLAMKAKGNVPSRMLEVHLRTCRGREPHFDPSNHKFREVLPAARRTVAQQGRNPQDQLEVYLRYVPEVPLEEDTIAAKLASKCAALDSNVRTVARALVAFLEGALELDPFERLTPEAALSSTFYTADCSIEGKDGR
mmetsp:Transcript_19954/g.35477  ORF Transcript_19954/g.35477 Transcript_19954/m.35477 type:complete len:503 (+) Transcript_19954:59-1567(+)